MVSPIPRAERRGFSLSQTLTDLLQGAGLGKADTIRITGPAGLAALLWFCRHGYEQVGYVSTGRGPCEDGDLLLVPQTCTAGELEQILRSGPRPRPGGVLIVQTPQPASESGRDPVHDLLGRAGYQVERCLHGRHRELHVARRRGRPEHKMAA
ncbi:MAG: hypothetical protein JWO83_4570 [Caulobacteraceae bacterium]|nr:hypothetical protein [Caulobacteraceae bacterium]